MSRLTLEQLSDFGDYTGSKELSESQNPTFKELPNRLSNVRLSPDGRHVHVILSKPKVGLVTFDKYERPQLAQNQKKLDLCLTKSVPIVDILYLDNESSSRGIAVAAVVYENGKAEIWKFQECTGGWHLLQTSDLCNSPRARVVSVCACSKLIIWCEERPPSESSPALSSNRNKLRYCVCRREFDMDEMAVSLGGVKIALHNNPKFTVISSGDYVHLLPDIRVKPLLNISKFFLSWYPQLDFFRVSTTCKSTPLKRLSAKESDFRRVLTDCLGYLSALEPPEICDYSPSACGGLLLLLSTGWVCLLQKDGMLRHIYRLADNNPLKHGVHTSLCMYQDTLALLIGQNLHLIDSSCGRELEKITLAQEGVLYTNQAERCTPHLLLETGLFAVVHQEADRRDSNTKIKPSSLHAVENIQSGALLVEAVFEEACKYYQQRSLSSTQLTVDALKQGGRFQAPISLAYILRSYLNSESKPRAVERLQNGGGGCIIGQDKLKGSLEAELKAMVSLEEVKGSLVKGGVKEVEGICETLVEKEVTRLLSSSELDEEALLYLNDIFTMFPCQAWRATQAALQLQFNGEGSFSSRAHPDVWKTVLSHVPTTGLLAPLLLANGGPKHKHSFKAEQNTNSKFKSSSTTLPAVLPVFELLCHSVFTFQPSWLPRFLELAQQQQGSAGLSLSLATSSWSFTGGRGGEGGENSVPLYKRVLSVLSCLKKDRDQHQDIEVEVMMVSGRPNAILQALRVLIGKQQWERVTQMAQKFCKQSPLLNKEIFTTLLCEVTQHRDLDPYLDLLWALCPEDITVTAILNLVLKNLPSPNTPSPSSLSISSVTSPPPAPFADPASSQLTIGLLKPLLRKVLQRETKPSQRYADILQSPTYPPPAPPRQHTEQARTGTDPDTGSHLCNDSVTDPLKKTPDYQPCNHATVPKACALKPSSPL